jgi:colanic acid/amylovoran biosynthesis glycosyltransferase
MRLVGIQRSGPSLDPAGILSNRPMIVYLVNQYPAVSHTFVKREVIAVERLGVDVIRVAARAGRTLVDADDVDEEKRTTHLLRRPLRLLQAAMSILALRPRRFVKALVTTLRMMRRSDRAHLVHTLCLVEACGVAAAVRRSGADHIHAHFGPNPAEVALLASQLAGASHSFTVRGCECLRASREDLWAMGRRGRERVLALHDVDRKAAALVNLLPKTASRRYPAIGIERRLPAVAR